MVLHHAIDYTIDLKYFLVVFVDEFDELLIDSLLKGIYLSHQPLSLTKDLLPIMLIGL